MTSIDCTDIKAILSPYIDGELDDHTRHLAERHLGECVHCRSLVDQAEQLDALIAADVEASTPAGLTPHFIGAVMARTVYAEPRPLRFTGRKIATWTGWFAAAAAFALAAGIWIDQNMRPVTVTISSNESASQTSQDSSFAVAEAPSAEAPRNERALDDDFYAAGIDLQSRTFEGALPAAAFRTVARSQSVPESVEPAAPREVVLASVMPIEDETSMAALLTPQAAMVTPRRAETTLAQAMINAPTIEREDADVLYTASILMHLLTSADSRSFADVEHVRQVVEVDNLLPRLTEARDRLQPADRPAVFAAESVLTRVTQGPLDSNDVLSLRDTVATLNLSSELGEITHRWDRASSL